jgi:hypothetical protein
MEPKEEQDAGEDHDDAENGSYNYVDDTKDGNVYAGDYINEALEGETSIHFGVGEPSASVRWIPAGKLAADDTSYDFEYPERWNRDAIMIMY